MLQYKKSEEALNSWKRKRTQNGTTIRKSKIRHKMHKIKQADKYVDNKVYNRQ